MCISWPWSKRKKEVEPPKEAPPNPKHEREILREREKLLRSQAALDLLTAEGEIRTRDYDGRHY